MVNSFDLFVIQKRHPCQRQEYEFHVNLLNLSSRVQRCVYSISWSLMTCLLGFFTSERSSVLSPHTLPSLELVKNSAKISPLHHKVSKENKVKNKTNSDYPFWQIPRLWGILPDRLCYFFFENYRISSMQCLFSVASVPPWVVIPYLWKHSSLPWAYVSPGVPKSTTTAAKQLSAALESHPTWLLASIFT